VAGEYLERAARAALDRLQLFNVALAFDLRRKICDARVKLLHVAAAGHLRVGMRALDQPLDSAHFAREDADDVCVGHERTEATEGGRAPTVDLSTLLLRALTVGRGEHALA
jgi:hypothetical protein